MFVKELAADFRQVMETFTASYIRIGPKNVSKNFYYALFTLQVATKSISIPRYFCSYLLTSLLQ